MRAPINHAAGGDTRTWIDLTDWELHQAFWFHVPKFPLKTLHSVPLSFPDGSPSPWADFPARWRAGCDRIYVRQAWRYADRIGDLVSDPFSFSAGIDREVKAYRESQGLPPLPAHMGSWNPPATMPVSACRAKLMVRSCKRLRVQSITENDAIDHGIWRGDISPDPGKVIQGYRRDDISLRSHLSARMAFAEMFDAANGDGAWRANPEVLTIEFRARPVYYRYVAGDASGGNGLEEAA